MAHSATVYTRSWAADSKLQRVRLASKLEQAESEIALLREEIRIKDGRMEKIPAPNRPHYPPTERLAILELKAARGWNLAQTANTFLLEPETIASWLTRVDEDGEHALVQMPEPVNKFPDFVRHVVQRLKVLCPVMGKKRIADTLARAGLHLAATTVGRILKAKPATPPTEPEKNGDEEKVDRVVTAKYPNHVWHIDLTTVPTSSGFCISWFPLALPQRWPFCYWIALVVDHFSRKCMGFAVFLKVPSSLETRRFLGRVIRAAGTAPRHAISDRGVQFDCAGYRRWAKRRKIRIRYGAVGKYGSIAIIERFIRSLKQEHIRRIQVPFRLAEFRSQLGWYVTWYNGMRPHRSLKGRTPDDLYSPTTSAPPQYPVHGDNAVRLDLVVWRHHGQRHLPVVELHKVA
jgi:putative transposase